MVTDHSGFDLGYWLADTQTATPDAGLQVHIWLIDLTSITLCCHAAVTSTLKVISIQVVVLEAVEVVLDDVVRFGATVDATSVVAAEAGLPSTQWA